MKINDLRKLSDKELSDKIIETKENNKSRIPKKVVKTESGEACEQ